MNLEKIESLSHRRIADLEEVFRHSWTEDEMDTLLLRRVTIFYDLLELIRGNGRIVPIPVVTIDGDAIPQSSRDDLVVHEHNKLGNIEWYPGSLELCVFDFQTSPYGGPVRGSYFYDQVRFDGRKFLNASVLDRLEQEQHLIPTIWSKGARFGRSPYIPFWGTIYRDKKGKKPKRYVRALFWSPGSSETNGSFWSSIHLCLDGDRDFRDTNAFTLKDDRKKFPASDTAHFG